jgi:hypothetical protein
MNNQMSGATPVRESGPAKGSEQAEAEALVRDHGGWHGPWLP